MCPGERQAETAEGPMGARHSAYAVGDHARSRFAVWARRWFYVDRDLFR
jgi:uncharacterized protein YchJ